MARWKLAFWGCVMLVTTLGLAGCADDEANTSPVAADRLAPSCEPISAPPIEDAKLHALTNGMDQTWEFAIEYQIRLGSGSHDVCRLHVVRVVLSPGERVILPYDDAWAGADLLRVNYSSAAMSTGLYWPECWDATLLNEDPWWEEKDGDC